MIDPLLSAHRSQIRERERPALLFPLSFRQTREAGAANWNSELFALAWSVLYIRGTWCYPRTHTMCLLPERERKKCFTQACYASPGPYKKAGMMEAQFQHRLQHEAHVPPFALICVSYPCGKVLMRKHIILSVCMHNLLHVTPYVWLLEHVLQWVCVCFLSIYSMTVKIWVWWWIWFFD